MDNDYLEHFALFHSEKTKILESNIPINCIGCKSEKYYRQSRKELIISCGDDKSKECGIQFKIKLPAYIHKDKEINNFKKYLENGLNFETLYKYKILEKDKYDELKDIIENKQRGIDLIIEKYDEFNLLNKKEKINEFYENRKKLLVESRKIMKKIKMDEGDKIQNKQNYIGIIQQINDEFKESQQFLNDINPYIELDKPEVEIINDNYKEKLNSKKDKKSKKNKFLTDCEKIMCDENIYKHKDFKKWSGKNHPDKSPGLDIEDKKVIEDKFKLVSNCNDEEEYCPNEKPENIVYKKPNIKEKKLEIEGPELKEPEPEKPKPEKSEESEEDLKEPEPENKKPVKKSLTIDDFKEGMKVKWLQYNKEYTGTVGKINKRQKNKITINWDDGKKKPVNIEKLTII